MNTIYQLFAQQERFGAHCARITLAILLLWIGILKFILYDATVGVNYASGALALGFAFLLLGHYIDARIGFYGAALCTLTMLIMTLLLFFKAKYWVSEGDYSGIPFLNREGQSLLKDLLMIVAAFISMVDLSKLLCLQPST